ncbi:MAG: agmatinase family protein [Halobacteriota archaeon]|uniref:agmatinase family protein n=1 Tax=Natronomonas sp. TaxID=2184060 RepID=UPI003974B45E
MGRSTPSYQERVAEITPNSELAYAGLNTFFKSEYRALDDLTDLDAAVIGAPYDGAVSNRPGARFGPTAIRKASAWWSYLSGYKGGLTNMRTGNQVDFSDLDIADCGDIPVFPMDEGRTAESIEAHVAAIADQTFPVVLGGDHFCTAPSFIGFAEGADYDTVGLVQIDAHSDTSTNSPIFGEQFHGSSTALIANSEYSGYEHVSQVGIRGYEAPGFNEFAEEKGLSLYTMRDVNENGISDVVSRAIEDAASDADAVYVTFDIDSVDPSVAPGTGTPEPGGLSAYQALTSIEMIGSHDSVQAADMMEVSPPYDSNTVTEQLAAYLLVTLLERRFLE